MNDERSGRTGRPGRRTQPKTDPHAPEGVRLQKVLAQAGIGSRRACEELIEAGRVEVDGVRVRSQGMRVDPGTAVIRVDGMRISTSPDTVYLALNKPRGVVSTMTDPQGRPSLGDYVAQRRERLFHVGRLDADTEGLILLTNDGELAHRLSHPSYEVLKTYLAQVPAPIPRGLGRRLRDGVELEDGPAKADAFRVVSSAAGRAMVEIVLHEGRNHIVRRMLAAVGHPVERLVRTRVGPVPLGDLRPGKMRPLTRDELGKLFAAVEL
jgi:23S rRNA pseudouridine2605 synthase